MRRKPSRGGVNRNKIFLFPLSAFTLSEVLITLVIIGIVAAIAVPVIINHNKWLQYRAGTLKALAALNQANILWHAKEGTAVECGYWLKNPYVGEGKCNAVCKSYNSAGNCTGWKCSDNSDMPSDYNGNFADCINLYEFYKKNMNISKVCDSNAYANGCIPEYEGNDTVYKANNEGKSDYETMQATSGCGSFRKQQILSNKAFVTTDGTIFFPYGTFWSGIMAVDVNGMKGPNKWGHDVHVFNPKMATKYSDPQYLPGGCEIIEKGGISGQKLLYKK